MKLSSRWDFREETRLPPSHKAMARQVVGMGELKSKQGRFDYIIPPRQARLR